MNSINEVIVAVLTGGEMVRAIDWDDGFYIHAQNGQVVDQDGKPFNIKEADVEEWEIYEEDNIELLHGVSKELNKHHKEVIESIGSNEKSIEELAEFQKLNFIKLFKMLGGEDVTAQDALVKTALPSADLEADKKEVEDEDINVVELYYGVNKLEEVLNLFTKEYKEANNQDEVIEVLIKFMPFAWMNGRAWRTSVKYHAKIRSIIKSIGGEHEETALHFFKLPPQMHEDINNINTKKVIEKQEDKDQFSIRVIETVLSELKAKVKDIVKFGKKGTLEDYKNTIGLIVKKQQSAEYVRAYYIASYLALTTGRRMADIIKTMEIKKHNRAWHYTGLTKKRSDEEEMVKAISIDGDMELLQKALKLLRSSLPEAQSMTAEEVNSKYNAIFNKNFKSITGLNMTFHEARDVFAELAHKKFGANKEERQYKAEVLGHKEPVEKRTATDHYMTTEAK